MKLLYVSRSAVGHDRRFIEAWKSHGIDVETSVITEAAPASEGGSASAHAQLQATIERFNPDIIQVGPVTDPAWDLVQVWRGPLIVTSWGFDLMDEVVRDPDADEKARRVLARTNLLFVDNDATWRRAMALGMSEQRIVQFPWGLDGSWFAARMHEPLHDHGHVEFLCTRRHEEIYRVADVVDAFVAAAQDTPNIYLRLFGAGSLTDDLAVRVTGARMSDRVVFAGESDPFTLSDAYRQADAYVTASAVDGSSVSLLEAMASGAPVIASQIEGNAQWVSDETGFGFELGDTSQLEAMMRRFASGEREVIADIRQRARNAAALVRDKADWVATVRRFPEFARAATRAWAEDGNAEDEMIRESE